MAKKNRLVTVRVPEWVARDADQLAEYERRPRSQILREVIEDGVKKRKIDDLMERHGRGEISIGRVAELAGISYLEALEEARKRPLPPQYTMRELEEDLAAAKEWAKSVRRRRR